MLWAVKYKEKLLVGLDKRRDESPSHDDDHDVLRLGTRMDFPARPLRGVVGEVLSLLVLAGRENPVLYRSVVQLHLELLLAASVIIVDRFGSLGLLPFVHSLDHSVYECFDVELEVFSLPHLLKKDERHGLGNLHDDLACRVGLVNVNPVLVGWLIVWRELEVIVAEVEAILKDDGHIRRAQETHLARGRKIVFVEREIFEL